jgi:hypothetical protein
MFKFPAKYDSLKKTVHYAAASVILLGTISQFKESYNSIILLIVFSLAGLLVLLFAIYYGPLTSRYLYIDPAVNCLEALLFAYYAFIYSGINRTGLSIVLYIAAFNYLLACIISIWTIKEKEL